MIMGFRASVKFLGLSFLFGILVLLVISTFKSLLPTNPDANSSAVANKSQERQLEKREMEKDPSCCRWEENRLGK